MLEFGDFRLDPERRELLRDGEPLAIQAKLFDTLVVLAENHDRVVEKQELLNSIWPGSFVEESTLFQTVSALRKALSNGHGEGARYIATIPGKGYRFVAPVRSVVSGRVAQAAGGARGIVELPVGPPVLERRPQRVPADVRKEAEGGNWRRAALVLLAALAAVSVTAVALWLNAGPESPPRPLRRFAIELDHAVGEAVISPNGRYIAYTRCRSSIHGFGSLWVRDLKTGRTANLVEAPVVRHIAWSPTSDFVAYGTSYGRVKSVQKSAAPNGPSIKLSDLPTGLTGCAWSPDGESILLAVARSRTLFTIPARGGALSPFIELSGLGPRDQFFHPAWIQDDSGGSAVIGSQGSPRGEDIEGLEMVLYRPGTGTDPEELAEGFAPAYSPSGHLVYLNAAAGLMALPFSTASMAAAGERFPIAAAEGPQGASITADGAMVYVRVRERGREQLVWRDRQGKKLAAVGQPQFYVAQPQLSPDGRRAITVGGTHWGESIWMQDLDTQEASRLTFSKELDFCPVWSPDGRRLLHRSSESGNGDLYLRNADGSGSATKVLATERSEQPWDWSPDGRYILYGTPSKPTMQDVYYLELESDGRWSAPKTFVSTAGHERAAQFSPDGRFVAYVSDESGRDEVYVRSFPSGDGQRQVSRNGGAQPRWNPNGGELFYVEADALIAVSVQTRAGFSTGKAQALFRDRGLADLNLSHTYDVSPDGRRFVMVDWMANPQFSIEIVQNWYEEFREQERAATVR